MKPPHLVDADIAVKQTREKVAKAREEQADIDQLIAEALDRLTASVADLKAVVENLGKQFKS